MNTLKPLIALALVACSLHAFSQWHWIDRGGRPVFSDQGPGPEIPEKNVLKRPAGEKSTGATAPTDSSASTAGPREALPSLSKDTGVDKGLELKKKQAEAAEAAKRTADEGRAVKARQENCQLARHSKATLDLGLRMARTHPSGEREILDDAARAIETQKLQGVIDTDCKASQ
jgi:hypothetical protein